MDGEVATHRERSWFHQNAERPARRNYGTWRKGERNRGPAAEGPGDFHCYGEERIIGHQPQVCQRADRRYIQAAVPDEAESGRIAARAPERNSVQLPDLKSKAATQNRLRIGKPIFNLHGTPGGYTLIQNPHLGGIRRQRCPPATPAGENHTRCRKNCNENATEHLLASYFTRWRIPDLAIWFPDASLATTSHHNCRPDSTMFTTSGGKANV